MIIWFQLGGGGGGGEVSSTTASGMIFLPSFEDTRVVDFINARVTTPTGQINTDFKEACGQALGFTDAQIKNLSIDDIWKQYLVTVKGFTFIGNHVGHYGSNFNFFIADNLLVDDNLDAYLIDDTNNDLHLLNT